MSERQATLKMDEHYTITLTGAQVALIANGLGSLPYGKVKPLIDEIEKQLLSEQRLVEPVRMMPKAEG